MSKTRTVEIDWLNPTRLPVPSPGMEYELRALGAPVHVLEEPYRCRPVHAGTATPIRNGATVTAEAPGVKVELGPERPNTKED